MLNLPTRDLQTVLMKSGLDQAQFAAIQFFEIKSTCLWPHFLGHFVLNQTCFYQKLRPQAEDTFTFVTSENAEQTIVMLQEILPEISYVDAALLAQQMTQHPSVPLLFHFFHFHELLKAYRFHCHSDLEHIMDLLVQLPLSAQNHLHEKKWQWGDFQIFLSIKHLDSTLSIALDKLFSLGLSKSQMISACEMLIECWLSQIQLDLAHCNAENIKETLHTLRYPQQLTESKSPSMKNIQIKPMRQNDRRGFEFKFFSANSAELEKMIKKLQTEMEWR